MKREEVKLAGGTFLTVSDAERRSAEDVQLADGTVLEMHDISKQRKRSQNDMQLRDGSWLSLRDIPVAQNNTRYKAEKREKDKISSCGPRSGWIPVEDHGSYNEFPIWGYRSTVKDFCFRISTDFKGNPVILGAGKRASYTIRWAYEAPELKNDERDQHVGLKGDVLGHIEYENVSLMRTTVLDMADENSECYGPKNKDTKGGTWQMEDNQLTFHALRAKDEDGQDQTPPHDETR
ncbi:hypothetical protein P154DRAFT_565817 [Amniculicola lignicola CBS 123094]|uniref:Uncharacterized protein n=1 Tax=Amniculicola lignicola CBS 123094 TaxID=1392246 RepID=A0A6A5WC86_9PLEO|nr:hypothetical protein P154DRAFT_565817 [Amniculicola lignicola CBS 123094]